MLGWASSVRDDVDEGTRLGDARRFALRFTPAPGPRPRRDKDETTKTRQDEDETKPRPRQVQDQDHNLADIVKSITAVSFATTAESYYSTLNKHRHRYPYTCGYKYKCRYKNES